jgi:coproporphyrinogen III oxidase-like Fe-S oxidoreductase
MGRQGDTAEFLAAVECLIAAGYQRHDLGVYLLVGLPGQTRAEVERAVDFVLSLGLRPHLTEYSPVRAVECSPRPGPVRLTI